MTLLAPGMSFVDPVFDSQRCFRSIMNTLARPGHILSLDGLLEAPAPLEPVAAAVAMTLFDQDTPIWLDQSLAESPAACGWLTFHSGAPITTNAADAHFALVSDPMTLPSFSTFSIGSDRYPDRSTTLILQVDAIDNNGPILTGPGIAGPARLEFEPLPPAFWDEMARNHALFPRGIDVILAGPRCLAALPRSTLATNA